MSRLEWVSPSFFYSTNFTELELVELGVGGGRGQIGRTVTRRQLPSFVSTAFLSFACDLHNNRPVRRVEDRSIHPSVGHAR